MSKIIINAVNHPLVSSANGEFYVKNPLDSRTHAAETEDIAIVLVECVEVGCDFDTIETVRLISSAVNNKREARDSVPTWLSAKAQLTLRAYADVVFLHYISGGRSFR
jgi:hypothetical protein